MTERLSIDEIIGHCERKVIALEDIFGKEKNRSNTDTRYCDS